MLKRALSVTCWTKECCDCVLDDVWFNAKENLPDEINKAKTLSDGGIKVIRVGICCREKKMNSRPMRKILEWLSEHPEFEICRMNDDMILNKPIEEWLRCDVLIGFYSTGFPLQKAINYAEKYKPKQINDLRLQQVLWDRPEMLDRLRKRGILVPKSYIVLRGEDKNREEQDILNRQKRVEKESKATKNRGQYYIEKAKQEEDERSK